MAFVLPQQQPPPPDHPHPDIQQLPPPALQLAFAPFQQFPPEAPVQHAGPVFNGWQMPAFGGPPMAPLDIALEPTPESWHEPIDTNELLRLEQELKDEQKKWTSQQDGTAFVHDTSDNRRLTIKDETSTTPRSESATLQTAAAARPTLSQPMDFERICLVEFRRVLLRLVPRTHFTCCFTPEMVQCISNIIDDYVQYILTYSSSRSLPSTDPKGLAVVSTDHTGVGSSPVHQIRFHRSIEHLLQFNVISTKVPQIRAKYAQQPHDPNNWCQSTRVTRNLIDRWYQRYEFISPQPIPSGLSTEAERAVLGALVDWTLTNLIDGLAVDEGSISGHYYLLSYVDLWTALKRGSAYLSEMSFARVRVQFDVNANRPLKWIPLDQYPQRKPITYTEAFKLDHQESLDRMNQLNQTSWYMQPEKLLLYAQKFVRGQLTESNSIKKLRSYGIPPLQFFVNKGRPAHCYISKFTRLTTFQLRDVHGHQYRLVYESRSSGALLGSPGVSIRASVDSSLIYHSNEMHPDMQNYNTTCQVFMNQFQFALTPSEQYLFEQFEQFRRGLNTANQLIEKEANATNILDRSWFTPSITVGPLQTSSSIKPATTPGHPITTLIPAVDLLIVQRNRSDHKGFSCLVSKDVMGAVREVEAADTLHFKQIQQLWKQQKFERLFAQIEPLTHFSLFGPTFYKENHPIEIRRLFHSHVIDTALIDSGMQPLPRVLNDLISQYSCIDLPFIESEAHEQMSRYSAIEPLVTPSVNSSDHRSMSPPPADYRYPGVTNNPIETVPSMTVRRCCGYRYNLNTNRVELITFSKNPTMIS